MVYFQSRISTRFCFQIPNTELQIREISGPEKLIWDPPQWIQDNRLTESNIFIIMIIIINMNETMRVPVCYFEYFINEVLLPYYMKEMKFSRHVNFAIQKKLRNYSDANNECREHNMTRKLSDSHYVYNQERTSLLPLKRLQITFFTFLMNFRCKWMLWLIDSRTIIHVQEWTAYGHRDNCFVSLNFDVIVPLVKSFYLIQRNVK